MLSTSSDIYETLDGKAKYAGPGWPGYSAGPPGPVNFVDRLTRTGPRISPGRAAPDRALGPGGPFRALQFSILFLAMSVRLSQFDAPSPQESEYTLTFHFRSRFTQENQSLKNDIY